MGVADFPIELLRLMKIAPKEDVPIDSSTFSKPSEPFQAICLAYPNITAGAIEKGKCVNCSKTSLESLRVAEEANTAENDTEIIGPGAISPQSGQMSPTEGGAPLSAKSSRTKTCPPSAMASVIRGSFSRPSSRSSSPSRQSSQTPRADSPHRTNTAPQPGPMPVEAALGAGKGVGRIVGAGLKSPMDFTLGLARGFHNAPKLYGDQSVRPADKITDFQSGLKAAGKVSVSLHLLDLLLIVAGIRVWFLRWHLWPCHATI